MQTLSHRNSGKREHREKGRKGIFKEITADF